MVDSLTFKAATCTRPHHEDLYVYNMYLPPVLSSHLVLTVAIATELGVQKRAQESRGGGGVGQSWLWGREG